MAGNLLVYYFELLRGLGLVVCKLVIDGRSYGESLYCTRRSVKRAFFLSFSFLSNPFPVKANAGSGLIYCWELALCIPLQHTVISAFYP